jgi:hypothetical protein
VSYPPLSIVTGMKMTSGNRPLVPGLVAPVCWQAPGMARRGDCAEQLHRRCETEGPVTSGPVATSHWASSPPSYLTAHRPTRLSFELEEVVADWPIGRICPASKLRRACPFPDEHDPVRWSRRKETR